MVGGRAAVVERDVIGARSNCARCWGLGVIMWHGEPAACPCIAAKAAAVRRSLRSDWDRLAYDARVRPHDFPPFPCTQSSLGGRFVRFRRR